MVLTLQQDYTLWNFCLYKQKFLNWQELAYQDYVEAQPCMKEINTAQLGWSAYQTILLVLGPDFGTSL